MPSSALRGKNAPARYGTHSGGEDGSVKYSVAALVEPLPAEQDGLGSRVVEVHRALDAAERSAEEPTCSEASRVAGRRRDFSSGARRGIEQLDRTQCFDN